MPKHHPVTSVNILSKQKNCSHLSEIWRLVCYYPPLLANCLSSLMLSSVIQLFSMVSVYVMLVLLFDFLWFQFLVIVCFHLPLVVSQRQCLNQIFVHVKLYYCARGSHLRNVLLSLVMMISSKHEDTCKGWSTLSLPSWTHCGAVKITSQDLCHVAHSELQINACTFDCLFFLSHPPLCCSRNSHFAM